MGLFEIYESRALKHANQDKRRRRIARQAEPLVLRLLPGRNYVSRREFYTLSRFLLADDLTVDFARIDNEKQFAIGRIEVVIDPKAKLEWLTASEIAGMVGMTEKHMRKLLHAAKVSSQSSDRPSGGRRKKLYNFAEIMAMRFGENDTFAHAEGFPSRRG